jgi:hypothetical protein
MLPPRISLGTLIVRMLIKWEKCTVNLSITATLREFLIVLNGWGLLYNDVNLQESYSLGFSQPSFAVYVFVLYASGGGR